MATSSFIMTVLVHIWKHLDTRVLDDQIKSIHRTFPVSVSQYLLGSVWRTSTSRHTVVPWFTSHFALIKTWTFIFSSPGCIPARATLQIFMCKHFFLIVWKLVGVWMFSVWLKLSCVNVNFVSCRGRERWLMKPLWPWSTAPPVRTWPGSATPILYVPRLYSAPCTAQSTSHYFY